jgi:hypothetical protein
MSNISRRSILGYTGTAAAGAVLTTAASTPAAQAKETTVEQATVSGTAFQLNLPFKATSYDGATGRELDISFTLGVTEADGNYVITHSEVAAALSALAQSHGWPALTFYGTPVPAPLT